MKELSHEIRAGKLVTLSGIVGCGKTTILRRIQEALAQDREILVSKSLSVEKSQLSLPVLSSALFYAVAVGDQDQGRTLEKANAPAELPETGSRAS